MQDNVNHPSHYNQYSQEVITTIEEWTLGYNPKIIYHLGNTLKYIARAPYKGKLNEDLKKSRFYLDRAIQILDRENDNKK